MFYWKTAVRLFGVVYEKKKVLCAECVRPSVCYLSSITSQLYTDYLHRGLVRWRLCGRPRRQRPRGEKMGYVTEKNEEFKLLRQIKSKFNKQLWHLHFVIAVTDSHCDYLPLAPVNWPHHCICTHRVPCKCQTARKHTDLKTEGVAKHCSVRQGMRTPGQVQITERDLSEVT